MSLPVAVAILQSRNQSDLEASVFGGPIRPDKRNEVKALAAEQINRAKPGDPVGYKAMAQIQLGIIQAGLQEPISDAGSSVIIGWENGIYGEEDDILKISLMAWSVLAVWTDRADKDTHLRWNVLVLKLMELVDQRRGSPIDASQKITLMFAKGFLMVLSCAWSNGLFGMCGNGSRMEVESAAKNIDEVTSNKLKVTEWLQKH